MDQSSENLISTASSLTSSTPTPSIPSSSISTKNSSNSTYILQRTDDHQTCFHNLAQFYQSGLFTDLTLNCNGAHFKCHRVIVASVSLTIRNRLLNPANCNHCLSLDEIPREVLKPILRCIYYGKSVIRDESQLKPISDGLAFLRIDGISITIKPNIKSDTLEEECSVFGNSGNAPKVEDDDFLNYDDDEEEMPEYDEEEDFDYGNYEIPEGRNADHVPSTSTESQFGSGGEEDTNNPSESSFMPEASGSGASILEPYSTLVVDGKEKQVFRCHLCGQMKSSKYILQRHLQYFHKSVKDIACRLCESKVKYPSCLKRHVQNIHKINMDDYNQLVTSLEDQFQQQLQQQVQQLRAKHSINRH